MNPILYHPFIYLYLFAQKPRRAAYVSTRSSHRTLAIGCTGFGPQNLGGSAGGRSDGREYSGYSLSRPVTTSNVPVGVPRCHGPSLDPGHHPSTALLVLWTTVGGDESERRSRRRRRRGHSRPTRAQPPVASVGAASHWSTRLSPRSHSNPWQCRLSRVSGSLADTIQSSLQPGCATATYSPSLRVLPSHHGYRRPSAASPLSICSVLIRRIEASGAYCPRITIPRASDSRGRSKLLSHTASHITHHAHE